jgi:hypothetical protein
VEILLLWVRHDYGIGYRSGVRYCFFGRLDILLWVGDQIHGTVFASRVCALNGLTVVSEPTLRTLKESEVTSEQDISVAEYVLTIIAYLEEVSSFAEWYRKIIDMLMVALGIT